VPAKPAAQPLAKPAEDLISVDYLSGVCIVTLLTHELNSSTSEELSTQLLALLNNAKSYKFVLDFDSVRYMESSCFGTLVTFLKWLSRFDGQVVLANVSENIRFLFHVTALDKVFPIHPTTESALNFLTRGELG